MTPIRPADAIVAGHICLDIIPTFSGYYAIQDNLIVPGKLVHVGPAVIATGGAVSNTGLALHRLGISTRLMGKIGDDLFGHAILTVIGGRDLDLVKGMIVDSAVQSSYTIVISPPGTDRSFLHCPGANDTFSSADVDPAQLVGARIFHFGYPPIMQRMHIDGGVELAAMLHSVKQSGLATSLDMAHVDLDSSAGQVDRSDLLRRVLPYVDFFLPSLEEVFVMLDPAHYRRLVQTGDVMAAVDGRLLEALSRRLLDLGAAVVGLKLGDQGIYLRTTPEAARLKKAGALNLPETWLQRELLAPAFKVQVVGTTGAGDCAIAGFLSGMLRGFPPQDAINAAVAAGACNVEYADAISGIPIWAALQQRIQTGWERLPVVIPLPGWRRDETCGLWVGPADLLIDGLH